MYTKEFHFPFIGNLSEVTLEYFPDSKKLEVIWPDETRYQINEACIDNFESIKKDLIEFKQAKVFQISKKNFLSILFFEYKRLLLEFGLLPIKPNILEDISQIQESYAIYLSLNKNQEITILTPYMEKEHVIFKSEKVLKESKLITSAEYEKLKEQIKQNQSPLTIPEALKSHIREKNTQIKQIKTYEPNLKNIDIKGIESARQKLSSLKNIEELVLTEELEEIHQLMISQQKQFIQDNPLESFKEQEKNLNKIERLRALTILFQNNSSVEEYLQIANEFFGIVPKAMKDTAAIKPKSHSSKLSHSYNEDLVMSDNNLLTDKQIQKIGDLFLSESQIDLSSCGFDALVVTDKEAPHGLFDKIKNFAQSSQKYQMFAVNLSNIHWVYVFCFKDECGQIKGLYVDSSSTSNCDELGLQMQELDIDMQFHHLDCQKDGFNCGVWVLNFLEKTIDYIEKQASINRDDLLITFKTKTNISEKRAAYKSLHNQDVKQEIKPPISYDLEEDLQEIEKFYAQIESISSTEINQWANIIRKQNPTDVNHQTLLQAIAYLDRCFCINSGGKRLRDCQKQAILNFFMRNDLGHIAQINTGEGKTTIVACVQALKVLLQGYKGCVFTSNGVLAEDGVTKNKKFYEDLGITVAHNNPDENHPGGFKPCYSADIVYGTINNFQFDWLRHEFECQNTMGEEFDFDKCWAMLDEIDSLLIDQGGNLAKLCVPFPGMSDLEIVYLTIWEDLLDCSEKYPDSQQAHKHFTSKENQTLLEAKLNLLIEQGKVSPHLKKYLKLQLTNWISSAFCAYFFYEKNVQYNIEIKDGAPNILPIDNQNTGVSLHNSILCNGLHQFLQLKHGLPISFESPTSSFVSNIGFVQKFNNKISGVTGTIGADAEKTLLKQKINLEFSVIPPFQEKKFALYDGLQFDDEVFVAEVARHAISETLQGEEDYLKARSSLIICSSVKDVDEIHKAILELAKQAGLPVPKVRLYRNESEAKVTDTPIETGEIVIATNISGRGTDFHTSEELEENGGLHVIEAFLPCNQRVQDQGFGRTARQGKSGTGQMLIRSSEVEKLSLPDEYDFDDIISARDFFEQQRIEEIKQTKLAELEYHDKLFDNFSNLYREIKKQHQNDSNAKWHFVLKDLKEKWAMWLMEHVFEQTPKANVDEEFQKFREQALPIINGEIYHNPFYAIQLAESFLKQSSFYREPAKKQLLRLIQPDVPGAFPTEQVNKDMLYQAYMLLFEVDIEDGNQTLKHFLKALVKLINIPYVVSNDYLVDAKYHLELAKQIIQIKMTNIKDLLENKEQKKCTIQKIIDKSSYFEHENNLGKHFTSKLTILDIHERKIEDLLKKVHEFKESGATLEKSHNHIAKTLSAEDKTSSDALSKMLTSATLKDHVEEGASTFYELKKVHEAPDHVWINAKLQIGGGMSLLLLAFWLPMCAPVIGPLGGAMISEGITDILFSLFDQNEFSQEDYIKSKLISYGIAIATMGIGVVFQCAKMVKNTIDSIRKLAKRLNDASGTFATIKKQVGALLDKVANQLEKMLFLAQNMSKQTEMLTEINSKGYHKQYYDLSKLKKTVDLSPFQQIKQICGNAVKDGFKDAAFDLVKDKALNPALKALMGNLKTHLKQKVEACVYQQFMHPNPGLRVYSEKQISDAMEMIFNYSNWDDGEIIRKIGLGVVKSHSDWMAQLASFAIESIISGVEIHQYAETICNKLQDKMGSFEKQVQIVNEDIYKKLLDQFSENITDGLFSKVVALTQQAIIEVPKVANKAYRYFKQKKVEKPEVAKIQSRNIKIEDGMQQAQQAGTNCASHCLSHILEMDEHAINHGLNLLPSADGIHKDSLDEALRVLGAKQHVIDKPQGQASIIRDIEHNQSDRGILILKGQTDMQHVVGVKKGKDNKWFCHDSDHQHPIELDKFIAEKGASSIEQLRVFNGLNANNLIALQHRIRLNYIALASHPIKKQMHDSGVMFGGPGKKSAPQLDDKNKKSSQSEDNNIKLEAVPFSENEGLKNKLKHFKDSKIPEIVQQLKKHKQKLEKLQAENKVLEDKIEKTDQKHEKSKLMREKDQLKYNIITCNDEIKAVEQKLKDIEPVVAVADERIKQIRFNQEIENIKLEQGFYAYRNSDIGSLIEQLKNLDKLPGTEKIELAVSGEKTNKAKSKNLKCRVYRFEHSTKTNSYELQLNGVYGKQSSFAVVHYPESFKSLDTKGFNLKTESIILGIIKSLENLKKVRLSYEPEKDVPKKTNKGLGFFSTTRDSKYDYWFDYQPNGLTHLLKLRLRQIAINEGDFTIPCPWEISKDNLQQVIESILHKSNVTYICLPILIPMDSLSNHWVGVVFSKNDEMITATYLDSENQSMSDELKQGIKQIAFAIDASAQLKISEAKVPNQNFNNCGLELIENMTHLISGSRYQESLVLEMHQELYLQNLLLTNRGN